MKKIEINDTIYSLERDYKDAFNSEECEHLLTDYFSDFDYVLGDYSYGKLRLKGFRYSNTPKTTKINDIKGIDNYLKDYCSFDCKYFLLKKEKNK